MLGSCDCSSVGMTVLLGSPSAVEQDGDQRPGEGGVGCETTGPSRKTTIQALSYKLDQNKKVRGGLWTRNTG